MYVVADLHLHSKYSRAVSTRMVLPEMVQFATRKGVDILTVADWTHPLWFKEIKTQLEEASPGMYKLKEEFLLRHGRHNEKFRFLLSTEVACIYTQGGVGRRIHNLVFASSLEAAEKINKELLDRGANLMSDGRPILGLSSIELYKLVLDADPDGYIIPAHVWTPWFALYGSKSGFSSIDECFGDYAQYVYGIETGLSSDPVMNWRVDELKNRSILSFSDSHSLMKMAREATVFAIPDTSEVSFLDIKQAIMRKGPGKIAYTIEFYPEEGKYHYTGHRNCGVVYKPEDTKQKGTICPVCKRGLTVGVMEQVEKLANKEEKTIVKNSPLGIKWIMDSEGKHPPYVNLVQLIQIVAEVVGTSVSSQKTIAQYENMCDAFDNELTVLLKTPIKDIEQVFGEKIAEGIAKVRSGDIAIEPGFDGEYGKVSIWNNDTAEKASQNKKEKDTQTGFDF